DADGDTPERQRHVGPSGGLARRFGRHERKGVDLGSLDGGQRALEGLGGGELAGPEGVDERAGVAQPGIVHAPNSRVAAHMDAADFVGLEPTDEPHRWRLPGTRAVSSGIGALFGGVGLAAAVEAMERHTGRPLVWATAQYLSFARPPSVVDIEVVDAAVGHKTSQVRATGHVGDEEIFTVNAAL